MEPRAVVGRAVKEVAGTIVIEEVDVALSLRDDRALVTGGDCAIGRSGEPKCGCQLVAARIGGR